MNNTSKRIAAILVVLMFLLSACRANISRNADGSTTVETTISQQELQDAISAAIADPLVKNITVSLQTGYLTVSGERQRLNDDSKTDVLSFRLDLSVSNGLLVSSVSNAQLGVDDRSLVLGMIGAGAVAPLAAYAPFHERRAGIAILRGVDWLGAGGVAEKAIRLDGPVPEALPGLLVARGHIPPFRLRVVGDGSEEEESVLLEAKTAPSGERTDEVSQVMGCAAVQHPGPINPKTCARGFLLKTAGRRRLSETAACIAIGDSR